MVKPGLVRLSSSLSDGSSLADAEPHAGEALTPRQQMEQRLEAALAHDARAEVERRQADGEAVEARKEAESERADNS